MKISYALRELCSTADSMGLHTLLFASPRPLGPTGFLRRELDLLAVIEPGSSTPIAATYITGRCLDQAATAVLRILRTKEQTP
jgi:hypothetical protein